MKTNVANVLFGTGTANGLASTVQSTTAAGQKDLTNSFANTFNSTAGKTEDKNVNQQAEVKQSKTVVENKPIREVSDGSEQPTNKTLDKSDKLSAAKEIAEDGKKIVEKIKEEFGVSDEAIEEAMQVLGITFTDLFNPEDLQNLMMAVTNTTDSIELITNDVLYNGVGDVMNFMNELKDDISKEFGMNEETFVSVANDAELLNESVLENVNNTEEVISTEETEMVGNTQISDDTQATSVNTQRENNETSETVQDDESLNERIEALLRDGNETPKAKEETVKVEVNVEEPEALDNKEVVTTTTEAPKANSNQTNSQTENQGEKENNSNENTEAPISFTTETTVTNTVGDVVEVIQSYSSVEDNHSIMRQITEQIKVNVSANSTSMEMMLHPASLGTVNMQVVSQNGQVTAHFTVQDEAVKAILENQMLSLQETLNEQGTKVTAIEVTVAGYNLDKGSENQPNEGNSQNGKKGFGKRSSINLSSLDSLEDLDDEEQLEAKVMEMNGNTVSYSV